MAGFKKINKVVSKEIKVSIIILSWNTKDLLKQCFESLKRESKRVKEQEIIVVDNGSVDGSVKYLKKLKGSKKLKIKIIQNKQNLGFAKGNNKGIRAASGDLVMILNSDTIVQKGAIEKLVDFYQRQKDKNIAFSPLLLNPDGTIQQQYYLKFPNLWQILFYHHPLLRPLVVKTPLRRLLFTLSQYKSIPDRHLEVDLLTGAALMAPKEIWQKVGLLDEDFRFLFEDVDWSWRAKKAGVKLFLISQAKITHLGGSSWQKRNGKKASFEFYCQHFDSFLLFVRKNYGQSKEKIYRCALLFNFLTRGKFRLFKYFLTINN